MDPSRIRAIDLLDRMEAGEETVLIDTRNPKAWAQSDQKLPGACEFLRTKSRLHTHKLPRDQVIVSYCS